MSLMDLLGGLEIKVCAEENKILDVLFKIPLEIQETVNPNISTLDWVLSIRGTDWILDERTADWVLARRGTEWSL